MQVFYINLARRPERRAFMEEQFARLGLAATRLEAVTPADLSPAEIARSCDPSRWGWMTPEELCCGASHRRAYAAFLSTDAPWAAVFEDDAILSPRLPAFLDAFETAAPPVDLVRLETNLRPRTIHRRGDMVAGIRIARYVDWEWGSAGYLISRHAAKMHLDSREMGRLEVDSALFRANSAVRRRQEVRQADPALCTQLDLKTGAPVSTSDLSPVRRDRLKRHRLQHVFYRAARSFHRRIVLRVERAWHRVVLGAEHRPVEFAER